MRNFMFRKIYLKDLREHIKLLGWFWAVYLILCVAWAMQQIFSIIPISWDWIFTAMFSLAFAIALINIFLVFDIGVGSMYKNRGYFTHTLPCSARTTGNAKLLSLLTVEEMSVLICLVPLFVIGSISFHQSVDWRWNPELFEVAHAFKEAEVFSTELDYLTILVFAIFCTAALTSVLMCTFSIILNRPCIKNALLGSAFFVLVFAACVKIDTITAHATESPELTRQHYLEAKSAMKVINSYKAADISYHNTLITAITVTCIAVTTVSLILMNIRLRKVNIH